MSVSASVQGLRIVAATPRRPAPPSQRTATLHPAHHLAVSDLHAIVIKGMPHIGGSVPAHKGNVVARGGVQALVRDLWRRAQGVGCGVEGYCASVSSARQHSKGVG